MLLLPCYFRDLESLTNDELAKFALNIARSFGPKYAEFEDVGTELYAALRVKVLKKDYSDDLALQPSYCFTILRRAYSALWRKEQGNGGEVEPLNDNVHAALVKKTVTQMPPFDAVRVHLAELKLKKSGAEINRKVDQATKLLDVLESDQPEPGEVNRLLAEVMETTPAIAKAIEERFLKKKSLKQQSEGSNASYEAVKKQVARALKHGRERFGG